MKTPIQGFWKFGSSRERKLLIRKSKPMPAKGMPKINRQPLPTFWALQAMVGGIIGRNCSDFP
jgi:hypothetical protein